MGTQRDLVLLFEYVALVTKSKRLTERLENLKIQKQSIPCIKQHGYFIIIVADLTIMMKIIINIININIIIIVIIMNFFIRKPMEFFDRTVSNTFC